MVEKSYLVQKFARLKFGQFSVLGYSVGGEETVVQVPELNVCFDVGRAPQFALTSDLMLLSHGHMDHIAGLGYYLSQRHFQGMKPGTILLPRHLERPVEALLRAWQEVERQQTPFTLIPMSPGQDYEVRRDFVIRAVATHHGAPSLGYVLMNIREKLRPEYTTLTGEQIAALRKQGVDIQYKLEVPMVAYLGDTSYGEVFDHQDVMSAQVLLCECTFFDPGHRAKAKAGKHLHVEEFVKVLEKSKNENVVVLHVSRRTGIRRSKHLLRKMVSPEIMAKTHFLMDFDDSKDAGDLDNTAEPGLTGA
ncbi:MAG: putative ribonuclease [Phycisphaerales bacterium]|nr:putative ribonuclease [Phycisphaerales bacterium]